MRPASSSARIIFLMSTIRWPSKNMCSVRQRPIPSAPNSRALAASLGVSALVRTLSVAELVGPAPSGLGEVAATSRASTVGTLPIMTSPVVPLIVRKSPALTVWPLIVIVPAFSSIRSASQPTTQGLPQPRATTAAWLALPPVAVRMPLARCMPGDVLGAGLLADQEDRARRGAPRRARRRPRPRGRPCRRRRRGWRRSPGRPA